MTQTEPNEGSVLPTKMHFVVKLPYCVEYVQSINTL